MNLRFNPANYYDHQWQFLTSKKENGEEYKIKGLVGGLGCGKTYIFLKKTLANHISKVNSEGKSNGWIIYPTYELAEELFIQPFIDMLQEYNIDYEYNIAKHRIETGYGVVKIYQLQKPQRIIGASLNYIGFDEFDVESWKNCDMAFKKSIGRMRGSEDTEIYIVTSPEGFHYTHKIFVEDANDDRFLVHGKTTDNKALPEAYIKLLENTYDSALLKAYRDGEFTNITNLNTYYQFSRTGDNSNVQANSYNPTLPVRLSCDHNVSPTTGSIFQTYPNSPYVRVFDEIELHHSGGSEIITERLAQEVKARYPNNKYIAYPDPSGKARKTSSLHTDHQILARAGYQIKVKPASPRITDSVNAVNKICEGNLIIDPSCKGLITDLEQTVNKPGTREIDKSNKERTHFSDGLRYAIDFEYPIIKPIMGSIAR
tara:strand:- start:156 stop:1439 length:1284 start_codon:yes stop_codon:yes gene_type:complete